MAEWGKKRDVELIKEGERRIEWAWNRMPVLQSIAKEWENEQPLKGVRVGACLHVTPETANLMRTLQAGGAEVSLCASNPLSTQDDVVAALNEVYQIPTFARRGVSTKDYYGHIAAVLQRQPMVTMDDGADLISMLHTDRRDLLDDVIGGTEETTTGVIRLRAMEADGTLAVPVVAVNDAMTKHFFDNRYGTGQSTMDGILRATNVLLAGKTFVVIGYGWCGRGIARKAAGIGAHVVVVEVDPLKALEAVMDGYRVTDMAEAAAIGQMFVTATGNLHVINGSHFAAMPDGAIVANAGHFNVEIDIKALQAMAESVALVRAGVEEYKLPNGRRIYLLAQGRLVNLACAEGHPAEVMDMSFANQALSIKWLVAGAGENRPAKVYAVPEEIDKQVAELKLKAMGVKLQELSEEQRKYLASWALGTTD
jgi:adenosylhomocysteinase